MWDALEAIGCDVVQGYYVGRPLPVGEFPAWARASRWAQPAVSGDTVT